MDNNKLGLRRQETTNDQPFPCRILISTELNHSKISQSTYGVKQHCEQHTCENYYMHIAYYLLSELAQYDAKKD